MTPRATTDPADPADPMNPTGLSSPVLVDVQDQPDRRGVRLDCVGISGVRYPLTVCDPLEGTQQTVATVALGVDVAADTRGAHLSRLVEVLHARCKGLALADLPELLDELCLRAQASTAHAELAFPFFLIRTAPVTGGEAYQAYDCRWTAERRDDGDHVVLGVDVPVTSVCPCSKAVSDYGAHNQRSVITIRAEVAWSTAARPDGSPGLAPLPVADLIDVAEQSASAPVYPLLKRPDERYVTMRAYDNAVFVEDMARAVAVRLRGDDRVARFQVDVASMESIHGHDAFARISPTDALR